MAQMKEEAEEARKEIIMEDVNGFDTQRSVAFDQRLELAVKKAASKE